jgi:dynein light intermediate chain
MNRKSQLTLGRQDDGIFAPSTIPSTQDDVNQLEERFNMMLYKEFALENGVCPKRRRIYDDLFNELIRIIKVHCSERGFLLERIKNEHIQWMNTYEELYSSSSAYGIRQYLYKMEEKKNLEYAIDVVDTDCEQLRDELEKESIRLQELNEQVNNTNHTEDSEHIFLRNNVNILRSTNKRLRGDLNKTLTNILSSSIFLGEPIDYEKKTTS